MLVLCLLAVLSSQATVEGEDPGGKTSPRDSTQSSDGRLIFRCRRFENRITVHALPGGEQIKSVEVAREPIACALTPDGQTLVVVHHLPLAPANDFYAAPVVSLVDTRSLEVRTAELPDGASGVRDVAIAPDGRLAFVPHVLGNYHLVPSQVEGGWTNQNAVSVIDIRTGQRRHTALLDEIGRGAANPWGVACSHDGRWLAVSHSGTHEVSLIDLPAMLRRLDDTYARPLTNGVPNDPGVLQGIRVRLPMPGQGPRTVRYETGRFLVHLRFAEAVASIDLPDLDEAASDLGKPLAEPAAVFERIEAQFQRGGQPSATKPESDVEEGRVATTERTRRAAKEDLVRRGERLFHDATLCYQQWQSCASCHPDGRADSLNWDLHNDGVGNPKNTKSLVLSHQTPPAMSTGVRASAAVAVRAGIEHILFADVVEDDARAIDAYLRSLRPVPSPHLVDGGLSASAERGRALFESPSIGCSACHPGPLFTDGERHDVGTQNARDMTARFDTPTLIESWRTAPYLHDGRYTTIDALLRDGEHGLGGGRRKRLSSEQLADLIEYVLSL